jgi:cell division protein FtsB
MFGLTDKALAIAAGAIAVLAILGCVYLGIVNGAQRVEISAQKSTISKQSDEIAKLRTNLNIEKQNVATLKGAVENQNERVKTLAAAAIEMVEEADTRLKAAEKRTAAWKAEALKWKNKPEPKPEELCNQLQQDIQQFIREQQEGKPHASLLDPSSPAPVGLRLDARVDPGHDHRGDGAGRAEVRDPAPGEARFAYRGPGDGVGLRVHAVQGDPR